MKKIDPMYGIIAFMTVLLTLAVLIVVYTVKHVTAANVVLGGIGAALCIGIAVFLAYFLKLGLWNKDANFFLFDAERNENIPVDELTYEIADEQLGDFEDFALTDASGKIGEIADKIFEGEPDPNLLKLVVPHALIQTAERGDEKEITAILSMSKDDIDRIEADLAKVGLDEAGRKLQLFRAEFSGDVSAFRDYFSEHLDEMKNAFVGYIKEHISDYD